MAEKMTMPKVGMMDGEIQLAKWLKEEGDIIAEGDFVADIESDKTLTQLESYVSGTILKIVVEEGDTVAIGTTLAIVGEPGEDISALLCSE